MRQFSINLNLETCTMFLKYPVQVTLAVKTIQLVKQNLIITMIKNLRALKLEASVTCTKKEKNLLNFSLTLEKMHPIQNEIRILLVINKFVKRTN